MPIEYKMHLLYTDPPLLSSERTLAELNRDYDRRISADRAGLPGSYTSHAELTTIPTPNDVMPLYYRLERVNKPSYWYTNDSEDEDEEIQLISPFVTAQHTRNKHDYKTDLIIAENEKKYARKRDQDYCDNRYTDFIVEKAKAEVKKYQDKIAQRKTIGPRKIEFHTY